MPADRAKRAAPSARHHAVFSTGCPCLQLILEFVGIGHGTFVSTINKAALQAYKQLPSKLITDETSVGNPKQFTCDANTILRAAVFGSPSRLRLASDCGVKVQEKRSWRLQHYAGLYASQETFLAAQELGLQFTDYVVQGCAVSGRLPLLQWLHTEQHCQLPGGICSFAARSGSVPMLQWLRQNQCIPDAFTMLIASEAGHTPVVQFLREQGCRWYPEQCCQAAAENGRLELLQYLLALPVVRNALNWPHMGYKLLTKAAGNGSEQLLTWFVEEQGIHCSATAMSRAATEGHLDACKYLRSQQCLLSGTADAAAAGYLDIVRWLHEQGALWRADTAVAAANYGHTAVLQFVHEHGCPYSTRQVCVAAARSGSMATLSYAVQRMTTDAVRADKTLWTAMSNATRSKPKMRL